MIKEIVTDEEFLSKPAEVATAEDAQVAQDLIDTMESLSDNCACLAANQIGSTKAVIAYDDNGTARVMFARHEGQDIGFIFGGMLGPCYRGQQFSYDAAWKDLSIGNLLQVEQIRWLCEEGAVRYDMGTASGEPMAYKLHWTEAHPTSQTWFLQPR